MNIAAGRAHDLATTLSERLTSPPASLPPRSWHQSLAKGAPGIALLHIERARIGIVDWSAAQDWLAAAASREVNATPDVGLYMGAPAVAFALQAAAEPPERYERARLALDKAVHTIARERARRAQERIRRGQLPELSEFDLIYGLTGLGAYLLRYASDADALEDVLTYLVRLTRPLPDEGDVLPGWWAGHDPSFKQSSPFAAGHANFGMAHGIAGPLALLSLASLRGITVDGHATAIETIGTWLDDWRQDSDAGSWWPQWITRDELRQRRPIQSSPQRPSWCYGTPGVARARQLAALASGNRTQQVIAEQAFADCLSDPGQLSAITDLSLCHGWAGIYLTAWHAARDSDTSTISNHLPTLLDQLVHHGSSSTATDPGLLEGDAGLALALHAATRAGPSASAWDACLLLT